MKHAECLLICWQGSKNSKTNQKIEDFNSSDLLTELKDNFSCRKNLEYDYGDVKIYMCKVNRGKGFEKCPKQIRVVFPSDSLQVIIQQTGDHVHVQKQANNQINQLLLHLSQGLT